MSLVGHALHQLGELIKDARIQLPPNSPGAIFIDIGGSQVFVEKLNKLMEHPAYASIVWIALWECGRPLKAVIKRGQQLDARLAEPF
jgi:hypothetical protein